MERTRLAFWVLASFLILEVHVKAVSGMAQQQQQPAAAVEPQQLVIVPAPVTPPNCVSFSEAAMRAGAGLLCVQQYIARNVTKIVCNEFKPECKETVTEWQLLNPTAPGAPADAYAQSAVAACHVMGFNTFTTGSQHMVGAAEDDCYTGKGWSRGNWWTKLVCCK